MQNDMRDLLKKNGKTKSTAEQLRMAIDNVEGEHHTILFLYKANRQRYGKLIKQM